MEALKKKQSQILKALQTLEKSIESYSRIEKLKPESLLFKEIPETHEDLERTFRDSMIQRFEFCVDTLWKYLKDYLETVEKISLDFKSPRAIFRTLAQARFISEQEAEVAIHMVDSRNRTSHIYKEEIAEQISKDIVKYHALMITIMQRIHI